VNYRIVIILPLNTIQEKPKQQIYEPLLTIAGILTIIGAFLAPFTGLDYIKITIFFQLANPSVFKFIGILGILGFAFGLSSAIFIVKRKYFEFSIFGASWLMVEGIILILWSFGS
jgi:hypothetical protein